MDLWAYVWGGWEVLHRGNCCQLTRCCSRKFAGLFHKLKVFLTTGNNMPPVAVFLKHLLIWVCDRSVRGGSDFKTNTKEPYTRSHWIPLSPSISVGKTGKREEMFAFPLPHLITQMFTATWSNYGSDWLKLMREAATPRILSVKCAKHMLYI